MKYENTPFLTDVKILWPDDWYDFELSGICEHNGEKFYFYIVDTDKIEECCRYAIIDLQPEILQKEIKSHELLVQEKGEDWMFHLQGPIIDPLNYPIVGWFKVK